MKQTFVFGVARGGTNLVARVAASLNNSHVVLDALLPVYKAWRDDVEKSMSNKPMHRTSRGVGRPIDDYYFSSSKMRLLSQILCHERNRQVSCDIDQLMSDVRERAALEGQEVPEPVQRPDSYRGIVEAISRILLREAGAPEITGVTWKDVWASEFVGPLSRLFPQAKFIVVVRDPRDVIASFVRMAKKQPSQHADLLSVIRHWRKNAELAHLFQADPVLSGRLIVLKYEDLCAEPLGQVRKMASFLMGGDESNDSFIPMPHLGDWGGNSSYSVAYRGVSDQSIGRWRSELDVNTSSVITALCQRELELFGYGTQSDKPLKSQTLFKWVRAHSLDWGSWRSTERGYFADSVFEIAKYRFVMAPVSQISVACQCRIMAKQQ